LLLKYGKFLNRKRYKLTDFFIRYLKPIAGKVLLLLFLALMSWLLPACADASTDNSTALDIAAIRAYADPITETTLTGLSANNFAEYTKFFNEATKAAVTKDVIDKAAAQINAKMGPYVSKEYLRAERIDEYIVVHYRAKYLKEEIGVRMVFDKDHRIAGQWFE
jgi:hypothetical protein